MMLMSFTTAKKRKSSVSPKHTPVKRKRKKVKKKPMDRVSPSTTSGADDGSPNAFTYESVTMSFASRKDKNATFERSLEAQLKKYPSLRTIRPKNIDPKDEPATLFKGRLRGYFAAKNLCRLWVLKTFDAAIARGEPFVKWKDPLNPGIEHDGTLFFAHFFCVKYLKMHEPGLSVKFDRKGALKNTSILFKNIVRYIYAHRKTLARRLFIYKTQCPYIIHCSYI